MSTDTTPTTRRSRRTTLAVAAGTIVTGAITGGTGEYSTAVGEAEQELLGFNNPDLPTMSINKTVELELART